MSYWIAYVEKGEPVVVRAESREDILNRYATSAATGPYSTSAEAIEALNITEAINE